MDRPWLAAALADLMSDQPRCAGARHKAMRCEQSGLFWHDQMAA
jgi:hypothetical protein